GHTAEPSYCCYGASVLRGPVRRVGDGLADVTVVEELHGFLAELSNGGAGDNLRTATPTTANPPRPSNQTAAT
ncbi:hypothetical protein, partial [Streptomyces sp. NPDC002690]